MADYEFLSEGTIGAYVAAHSELRTRIDAETLTSVNEIGDGNLNLVFLIKDSAGSGMCLKQALPYVRMTGEGWPMTPDRARHEAESLAAYRELTPELVPHVFLFDPAQHVIAMEDLSDHEVWRTALNRGEKHEGAAEGVGRFIGAMAFGTSAFALEREALSEAIERSQNPQLCTITEDLVFTEPLVDAGRNAWLPANGPDVAQFAGDAAMMRAMGLAKWMFMTHAEALIHGDLHTGSVMVRHGVVGHGDGSGVPLSQGDGSVVPQSSIILRGGEAAVEVGHGLGHGDGSGVPTRQAALDLGEHRAAAVLPADQSSSCDSVKVFDSEFAFYGPVAFDLGAVFANYVLAAARAYALGEDERAGWCLAQVGRTWQAFEAEFRDRWPSRRDPRVWGDAFLDDLLDRWASQCWLFAAAKMSRRIIGAAKVTDIETLPPALREGAARGVLRVARRLVVEREVDHGLAHLTSIIAEILEQSRTR